jgi:hypothetical protein
MADTVMEKYTAGDQCQIQGSKFGICVKNIVQASCQESMGQVYNIFEFIN